MVHKKLDQFPLIIAFIAEVAARMKGETTDFWKDELKGYRVLDTCKCGECHSFSLAPPSKRGAFNRGEICAHYGAGGDTLVIMHDNDLGQLVEVELPVKSDIPFLDEYQNLFNENYHSTVTEKEAQKIIQNWFEKHREYKPAVLVLDD